ncbi:MAG: hypothetical protein JO340_16165 [Acidobacteriaceae bacterium]|nr:hypothetical protein [Acidobacteriaceae bacterium]
MPDDTIRVSTSVDTSGLRSGSSDASAITAQLVADLKAKYASAQSAVKAALAQMSEAQQTYGEGAKRGATAATEALALYQAELDKVVQLQNQLKAELDQATAAFEKQAKAAAHVVPPAAAASGALRELEGHIPIRAAERFLATTLGLGPVLQAAFPIVGAVAMVDVIESMTSKVIGLSQ